MQPVSKRRYSFRKISTVVIGFYMVTGLMGLMVAAVTPGIPQVTLQKFLSWRNLAGQAANIAFSCSFYYFLINEYYRQFSGGKGVRAFIKPTLLSIAAILVFYVCYELTLRNRPMNISFNGKTTQPLTWGLLLMSYSFAAVFYIGISLLAAYLSNLRDERKEKKILEKQKLQLEAEKSHANFNFLKAQINPHFLHNTLNFLYSKSLPYSVELSEGILILSDIMRYALNQNIAVDGKVPLDDELEHLGNVIKINQLRFSNRLRIDFKTEGQTSGKRIIPFVLITLVENAFKHGDLTQPGHPLQICLGIDGHQISFRCHNKKKTGLKELSTGIGLDNIKKRLALTYGKDFSLTVSEDTEFYTTELKIEQL